MSSVAGSSAPEGDQGLTFDTDQRSAFSYTKFSNMSVRERGNEKKAFILGDVLSFRWFCTQRPLDYEVCNVSFENVLVALEHAQRSVLDLMQGYSFLCDIGAKAWCKNFWSDPLIIQSHPKFLSMLLKAQLIFSLSTESLKNTSNAPFFLSCIFSDHLQMQVMPPLLYFLNSSGLRFLINKCIYIYRRWKSLFSRFWLFRSVCK